jgi:hypothetical protein
MVVCLCLSIKVYAAGSSGFGLSPEQIEMAYRYQLENQKAQQQAEYQNQLLESLRQQNPFLGCTSLGEVSAGDIEQAKSLAVQLGANQIQFLQVSPSLVKANAYFCDKN